MSIENDTKTGWAERKNRQHKNPDEKKTEEKSITEWIKCMES